MRSSGLWWWQPQDSLFRADRVFRGALDQPYGSDGVLVDGLGCVGVGCWR